MGIREDGSDCVKQDIGEGVGVGGNDGLSLVKDERVVEPIASAEGLLSSSRLGRVYSGGQGTV